jgi:hypothetical protein
MVCAISGVCESTVATSPLSVVLFEVVRGVNMSLIASANLARLSVGVRPPSHHVPT